VALLETEVGFAPVSELTIEATGRLARRQGGLVLDMSGSRSFIVHSVDAPGEAPPEDEDLAIVASLAEPRSPDRIVVRQWKLKEQIKQRP
jgi:hypothetical protein